jgi:glycosyltransferase involved in cell wall biosynthesis
LGFVSVEDKHNAFAAAEFLCNPSWFESFSLVIMESWLAKRPILVSEHCAVTTNFCHETNGGLYYNNYREFRECIIYLRENKETGDRMGENGFEYVMEHFTHKKIAQNYLDFAEHIGL